MRTVVEKLKLLAAKQRECRGDMLSYGDPDPEITEAVALIEELVEALLEARLALETPARRVFNDNGDHTINMEPLDPDVYSACYYAARTVEAALAKAHHPEKVLK
jgi:hypothetical protein